MERRFVDCYYLYQYNPATGKYGLAILNVIRLGGVLTLLGMGAAMFVFGVRNKAKEQLAGAV